MNKGLALWFAVSSMALVTLCAILINESAWLALGVGVVAVLNIGWGFITKARIQRKLGVSAAPQEKPLH
ncbi:MULTISPECIES: hypothetical protein [Saccharibacillus]|uniref:Uncharacterized protein n=1 Tax=Saccharibacillus brassicae TaxID=2583377 RepID=A0A4Y6UVY3_SACBS|nr:MULTISPECIES: hypothetical protein [Saccharibacillus]MWJ32443.1 hypothetical protein [Saccharibacillus sp. WB 17]QDH20566.1 hypothetical protein FFV09_06620 [Saccharibacillus brassicae]